VDRLVVSHTLDAKSAALMFLFAMQSLTNAGLYPEPERKLQRKHSGDMAVFTGDLPASEACLAKDGGKPL